jgi:hypothetical protein
LAAIGTLAIKFHSMVRDFETVALSNAVLKGFHIFILKFNDLSTPKTDEMIMMAPSRSGFISGLSIAKFPLDCKTGTGEELQGSINSCITNFWTDLYYLGVDLSEVLMALRVKEDIEDLLPLFGRIQSFSRNPSLK